jgi:hypothetical protein
MISSPVARPFSHLLYNDYRIALVLEGRGIAYASNGSGRAQDFKSLDVLNSQISEVSGSFSIGP